ncbi:MAG: FG-GAP repeat protein [Ardenticatenales bacterium]|nr:FG-GAP repeat protein [Ardenticatenales bacterium]
MSADSHERAPLLPCSPARTRRLLNLTTLTLLLTSLSLWALRWSAQAAPPPAANPVVVREIDQARNLTINGVHAVDLSGIRQDVGDLNMDGLPDLVIGARQADPDGREDAGETYILFGPLAAGSLELSTDADVTIHGIDAGDHSGIGVAVGDFNADGINDLTIGARRADPDGRENAGEAYIIFGPFAPGVYELNDIRDVTFNGIDPFDETGVGVAGGDVNGDGYEDLTVGARQADPDGREDAGETYVVFGPFGAGMTVELAQADLLIKGKRRGDLSGYGVDTGDINHDGHLDLLVGAWAAEGSGVLNAGELYVLFGPRSAGTWDLNSDADITISGLGQEDHLGVGARSGDLNLDGYDDLMIGATTSDPDGRMEAGRAFIVYGPLDAGYYHVGDIANFYFNGIDPADYFGIGVANGDLTNDGIPDLIFGAFRADPHDKFNAGETYVVFGSLADVSLTMQANTPQPQTGMPLTYELIMANGGPGPAPNVAIVDRLSPDVTYAGSNVAECSYDPQAHAVTCLFPGLAANTAFSLYISVIPDTDGTITNTATIVSDVLDADLGNNAGIAMTIVAPACAGLTPTILGTEGADQLVGTAGNDVIFARGGDDTILGGDGDDVICGGTGDDQISGNAGSDQILGENGNDQLTGLDGDDTFWGGAGDDLIIGGPGNDSANCGSEDDYFDGGADYDTALPNCEVTVNVEASPEAFPLRGTPQDG